MIAFGRSSVNVQTSALRAAVAPAQGMGNPNNKVN